MRFGGETDDAIRGPGAQNVRARLRLVSYDASFFFVNISSRHIIQSYSKCPSQACSLLEMSCVKRIEG
jgi:hypothetical protein